MNPKGKQAGCSCCGRIFSTDSNFDKHIIWESKKIRKFVRCMTDEELVNVVNLREVGGIWKGPERVLEGRP